MPFDRRQFLSAGAAALLTTRLAAAEPAAAPDADDVPIVDTHQHLWDLVEFKTPWPVGAGAIERSRDIPAYLEAAKGLHVARAVYMEVAVPDEQLVDEAESVLELCRRRGTYTVAAVVGGRPADRGFRDYLARFEGNRYLKGVRHILPAAKQPLLYLDPAFQAGIRLLGEKQLCFDLCMPPARLPEAIKLVDACPETRYVLDHCGNADPQAFAPARRARRVSREPAHDVEQWRRDMAEIARREQVVCKISGIVAQANKDNWRVEDLAPIVNHCLEVFGLDRVMFASDWPVCTKVASLREWVEALREIVAERSAAERRKLFHDNAVRFYDLEARA